MVGVVVGMCVYMCHPPAPLFKSFLSWLICWDFFLRKRGGIVSCHGRCMEGIATKKNESKREKEAVQVDDTNTNTNTRKVNKGNNNNEDGV